MVFDQFTPSRTPCTWLPNTVFPFPRNEPLGTTGEDEDEDEDDDEEDEERKKCTRQTISLLDGDGEENREADGKPRMNKNRQSSFGVGLG